MNEVGARGHYSVGPRGRGPSGRAVASILSGRGKLLDQLEEGVTAMPAGAFIVYGNAKHQLVDGNMDIDTKAFRMVLLTRLYAERECARGVLVAVDR